MPRQSRRSLASPATTPSSFIRASSSIPLPSSHSPQLAELRKQWKWAVVGSFMQTFASLIALNDITLIDVENDLTSSTMIVLPRLMHRLLYTLTQDRKINMDTWQTSLRKQYMKRNPEANPIGPEPQRESSEPEVILDSGSTPEYESRRLSGENTIKEEITTEPDLKDIINENENDSGSVPLPIIEADLLDNNAKVDIPSTTKTNGVAKYPEVPQANVSFSESKDWSDLSMLEKLNSLHTVIEWHFQTPLRLRSLMRSDDEYASWRTEPIGFDSKHNTYWLIGVDRLWLQRQHPNPPRKVNKRKAVSKKKFDTKIGSIDKEIAAETEENNGVMRTPRGSAAKRKREAFEDAESVITPSRTTRRKQTLQESKTKTDMSQTNSSRVRAAKTQANVKLDEQAKQLAAAQAEMKLISKGKYPKEATMSSPRRPPPTTLGTRVSRRLRDSIVEDEWQQIPEEWLKENIVKSEPENIEFSKEADVVDKAKVICRSAGLDSNEGSELTELSDTESNGVSVATNVKTLSKAKSERIIEEDPVQEESPKEGNTIAESWPPPDFVEWETICVTLDEWENILTRLESSHHYLEKALYTVLSKEIVPNVTAMLKDAEIQRQKEEAIIHRKRSSRIAIKESEKEEARRTAQKLAEDEGRLARERRIEARAKKEEEERLAREQAREKRRKEREEREERMKLKRERFSENTQYSIGDPGQQEANIISSSVSRNNNKMNSGTTTPGEDWELDCEICGTKGVNQDDGVPLMSCGKCAKWQHISCHDAADARAGRTKRNWDVIDFTCKECSITLNSHSRASSGHMNGHRNTMINGYGWTNPTTHNQPSSQWYAETQQSGFPRSRQDPRILNHGQSNPEYYTPNNVYGNIHSSYYRGSTQEVPAAHNTGYTPRAPITFTHYQPDQRGFSPYVTSNPSSQNHSYVHQPYYAARPEQMYTAPKAYTGHHPPTPYSDQQQPLHHHQLQVNGVNNSSNGSNNQPHGQAGSVSVPDYGPRPLPQGPVGSHAVPNSLPNRAYPYHLQ